MPISKKLRERAIVEAFLRSQSYPASSLVEWQRERPDALLKLGTDMVGIEVTHVVEAAPRQPTAPQRWAKEAKRIVSAAQTSFERHRRTTLVVTFQFRPDWQPPGRREKGSFANNLAKTVERHLPANALTGLRFAPVQIRNPHPAVSWMYIGYTQPSLGNRWVPLFTGQGQPASASDIIETVRGKEPEVDVYRSAAPHVWLLIDCDLLGQGVALDVPTPSFALATGFDRVFCCGFGMWKWIEIPVLGKVSHRRS